MKAICAITIATSMILFGSAFSLTSNAADCPDYNVFFKEINPEKQKSWNNLYRIYKQTPSGCDDGAYAEGFSDFVVQFMAKHWDRFDELISLIKKDPSFQVFGLKHIDATADERALEASSKNAIHKCPASERSLCKEIDKKARAAIEDIKVYEKKD